MQSAPTVSLKQTMQALRSSVIALFVFSGIINLLALSLSLYLMQIFDRVLASGSMDTLVFLTLAVCLALIFSAILDLVRLFAANRISAWVAGKTAPDILSQSIAFRDPIGARRGQPLRDLAQLRAFLATPVAFNLFDAAWLPLYLLMVFIIHPMMGLVCVVGILALITLVWLNDRFTRPAFEAAQIDGFTNQQNADRFLRNAEVIDALGMRGAIGHKWSGDYVGELGTNLSAQNIASIITASSKLVRLLLQVALLAVGAVLVLDLKITGGAMIASTILVGRLLAPVEAAIGQWRQFVLARQSYNRLIEFQSKNTLQNDTIELPAPSGKITVSELAYVPPLSKKAVLKNIEFDLEAGDTLAIIGPSASGKTTLARLIIGVLKPTAGNVRFDGAEVSKWPRDALGGHIGYMPQEVELFPASIYANIARFEMAASSEVIEAAKLAGCHEIILGLPDGYETILHDHSNILSGGQRQRIGLARALFRSPRIVVLDEPNSHLDGFGEAALIRAIKHMKAAGRTVIIVAHRASMLRSVDKILVLQDGQIQHFGPRDKVLNDMEWRGAPQIPNPPAVNNDQLIVKPAGAN
jgi:ATP-binding cassette, subfamily C, bacterial exporter for protease/lipase